MRVRLLVGRWDQRSADGYVRRRRGDVVDVDEDVGEWLVKSGAGVEADADAEEPREQPAREPEAAAPEAASDAGVGERPARAASKADWVAYAVSLGMDADEASELSKQQLIAATAV